MLDETHNKIKVGVLVKNTKNFSLEPLKNEKRESLCKHCVR